MLRLLSLPAGVAIVLLSACGGLATLGPTPADEGVVIYIHAGFAGVSQALNVDVNDLATVEGPCTGRGEGEEPTWGDCVSSVRVLPGWTVTLFVDDDFRGRSVTLTADAPNLRDVSGPCDGSFNDCISSLRVARQ